MMEKDTEFIGAIEFSHLQHMQTSSLKAVRDMISLQVDRVPSDFTFLCQGREIRRVWEADRRAWSIIPFALRGSPGLRADAIAKNRRHERPSQVNRFEFRYMNNILPRYKKRIQEIAPVYRHRSYRLPPSGTTNTLQPSVKWQVASNWSGEWVYEQSSLRAKKKIRIQQRLRTAVKPENDTVIVKNHYGVLISPVDTNACTEESGQDILLTPDVNVPPKVQSLAERKQKAKLQQSRIRWKARMLAMDAIQKREDQLQGASAKRSAVRQASLVSHFDGPPCMVVVHIETNEYALPSRLIKTISKKRKRRRKMVKATSNSSKTKLVQQGFKPNLDVTLLETKMLLLPPSASMASPIQLGSFMCSTNISLENDDVEVFPVVIIRPIEEQIVILPPQKTEGRSIENESIKLKQIWASKSYLSEFEYEISSSESNFEALFQHIGSNRLQNSFDLCRRDIFGRTMLHDAAEYGHAHVMELLLKSRVLLNAPDRRGNTPLHYAAKNGHLKEVSLLLRDNATAWVLNHEGKSPLYYALETAARQQQRNLFRSGDGQKNYFVANQKYPKMRQVIDLLWDKYPIEKLLDRDVYDRNCCIELEKQVYGDFFSACQQGNLLRVQRLIDLEKHAAAYYVNNQMETLRRTALHEATEQGHTAIVDILIKIGADGYLKDQSNQVPLHIAARQGFESIVKCLILKFPRAVGHQDCLGKTPLHLAIENKHWNIAHDLITAMKGEHQVVFDHDTKLTKHPVLLMDVQDLNGYTALHFACISGQVEICTALLNAQASPIISRCEFIIPRKREPLLGLYLKRPPQIMSKHQVFEVVEGHFTSVFFDIEEPAECVLRACKVHSENFVQYLNVLKLLLEHRKESNATTVSNRIVKRLPPAFFHLAAEIAHVNMSIAIEACRLLGKYQIEINMVHYQSGDSVLLQECKRLCLISNDQKSGISASLELIHTLLEMGSNVNLPNETNGDTPLGCSAWYGHVQLLELLLEAGAEQDFFVRQGSYSSLHFAALGANLSCAERLLASNASINVSTSPLNEETPLFFAVRSGSISMVKMLLSHGADPLALCTVESKKSTSFGIDLDVQSSNNISTHRSRYCKTFLELSQSRVLSPLTFGLFIAQPLAPFGALEQHYGPRQEKKIEEWNNMNQICLAIARQIFASDPRSTARPGWITSEDIYLSCLLGYWELADTLLSHQIVLSNAASSATVNALHLASAAGKTSIVTALVSAGMNVNCNFEPVLKADVKREQMIQKAATIRQGIVNLKDVGILYRRMGPLFFSLINGHIETAAKLLVLGAKPQESLPHVARKAVFKRPFGQVTQIEYVTFNVEEAMRQRTKVQLLQSRGSLTEAEDMSCIHFVRHLEHSINAKVPLLRLVVEVGNMNLVKILVGAGMNIFDCFPSVIANEQDALQEARQTPIHYAVSRGHLDLVKYFAKLARYDFTKCFQRESQRPKSLLVSACETHRIDVLLFLLSQEDPNSSKKIVSGGFTYEENADEFQQALNASARARFAAGFSVLIKCGAKPDLETLANVLASISSAPRCYRKDLLPELSLHNLSAESTASIEDAQTPTCTIRYPQTPVETAELMLRMIIPFTGNLVSFLRESLSFDWTLQVMIGCARFRFWFMLEHLFVNNASQFVNPSSLWKPVILRAASCCSVLHCAASSNQVRVVKFLLAIGVPAELQLSEIPSLKCPIWYAATRGCLDTFLVLALKSPNFVQHLQNWSGHISVNSVFQTISSFTSFVIPGSRCKWQDLGVFGCFHVPKEQTPSILIQKFVSYAWRESKLRSNNSLLHSACSQGELLAVRVLLQAGANITAMNANNDTPLDIAARRKDSYGTAIVRLLVSALAGQQNLIEDGTLVRMTSRALVQCFAEEPPCNLKIAKVLLAGGADPRYVDKADLSHDGESNGFGSALYHALRSVQFSGVKLLLDHDALINTKATEVFLNQLVVPSETRFFWRRFAAYLKFKDQRLLEVESMMELFLDKRFCHRTLNEDLVHQLILTAANLAATVSKRVGLEQRFWRIVSLVLDQHPQECRSRKHVWGQKSSLHYAVLALQSDIVEKLLRVGEFDPTAEDEDRQTPLHLVAVSGDASICALLLEYVRHRTIDTIDKHGRTALHIAVIRGHDNVVKMLLHAGASMESRCLNGLNALLYALKYDRLAVIIELYTHISKDAVQARSLLFMPSGEHGIFLAAQHASFRVIRWFSSINESTSVFADAAPLVMLRCRFGRTLLHYASMFGDDEFAQSQLDQYGNKSQADHLVNAKDDAGYTPALYALAFGRIRVLGLVATAGADLSVTVDHSAEPGTHPYATSFDITAMLQIFAMPGWYAHASKYLPACEKRCVVRDATISEATQSSFCYRWRYVKRPDFIMNQRQVGHNTQLSKRPAKKTNPVDPRKRRVHTSMRSWCFPQMSLFDYICDTGDAQLGSFVLNLPLPLLMYRSTYQSQRQNFLQAVRWNYLDLVEVLLTATAAISKQDVLHFMDFLEVGIDCAMKRGLEQMALLLLSKWHGIKENGRIGADANVFAFQFAHVFQIACIRQMSALVEYMIQRGGQSLIDFQWNDGSALLYALAFGHSQIVKLLVDHGALVTNSHESFVAPSTKKWVEFGCPNDVLCDWTQSAPHRFDAHTREFVGPVEEYQPPSKMGDRLSLDDIREIIAPAYPSVPAQKDSTTDTEQLQNHIVQ